MIGRMCRVTKKPCDGNRSVGYVVFFRNLIDLLIKLRELVASKEYAFKEPVLERRPRLNRNIVKSAEIQYVAITVNRGVILHIDVDPALNHGGVRDTKPQPGWPRAVASLLFQRLDLHRILVGYAEMTHFTGAFEFIECLSHLFRLNQRIGTVQKEYIEILGFESFQDTIDGIQDMLFGEIEHALTNPAFGLQNDLLADFCIHMYRVCKNFLASSAAVYVGMVEEVSAFLQCG